MPKIAKIENPKTFETQRNRGGGGLVRSLDLVIGLSNVKVMIFDRAQSLRLRAIPLPPLPLFLCVSKGLGFIPAIVDTHTPTVADPATPSSTSIAEL